jgi:transposase
MMPRGGDLAMTMLANVQQATITLDAGILTDAYDIYARLQGWGYTHKTVSHLSGEYARDDDGDGFHDMHVHTIEGLWSLLRAWLRLHQSISQEHLPCYLGFFEFVYHAKRRGKALLGSLVELLPA